MREAYLASLEPSCDHGCLSAMPINCGILECLGLVTHERGAKEEDSLNKTFVAVEECITAVLEPLQLVRVLREGMDKGLGEQRVRQDHRRSWNQWGFLTWQTTKPPRLWQAKYIGRLDPCNT